MPSPTRPAHPLALPRARGKLPLTRRVPAQSLQLSPRPLARRTSSRVPSAFYVHVWVAAVRLLRAFVCGGTGVEGADWDPNKKWLELLS